MLMRFKSEDADLILKLCERNGIEVDGMYPTAYDAYVFDKLKRCESYYEGIIGEETLKRVRKEAKEELGGLEDISELVAILERKLDLVCTQLDSKPLGVYVFSNTMSLSLISLNDNTALIKDENNIFECDLSTDNEGNYIIKYKELELQLNEFTVI